MKTSPMVHVHVHGPATFQQVMNTMQRMGETKIRAGPNQKWANV